uniref:tetratricopeptide repeat protein 7B isoform X4 n=1 Tax=Pristiophorus japonicus TaxID=55135 RepID=UPI00398E70A6
MAAKKSGTRLEIEIERCRNEGLWDKIRELIKQLPTKLSGNDDLAELLLGELKLEQYLKENPVKQGASPPGTKPKLIEVKKHLTAALDRGNLKQEFAQEANLILAKCCYVDGDHARSLALYSNIILDKMQLVAVPVYRLRIIAESYATKGLCLEKLVASASPRNDLQPDLEQEIITCYEKAGDIALLYLQETERVLNTNIQNRSPKPGSAFQEQELGFFLETGLQRAHVIYFKNGNLTRGVTRFREILRAVETRTTQNLRMTIARQLAEILLRGMCEQSYWNPLEDPPQHSLLDDPLHLGSNTKNYALSRRPKVYTGDSIFCPQENTEEALLLLLISESMANRDAVLSRIPEHNNDRVISLQSASIVYDLLTIALGRRGQYEMLSELGEGEQFAKMVTEMNEKPAEFRAKGFLAIGLTYSLQATDATLRGMQEDLQKKALRAFQRAHGLSPTDHLAAFYLALQLAISRQIPEALGYVRQALQLQGDDVNSLHLLALLLSAQKHYHDAVNIIDMALSEYPEHFILLFTKIKLESVCRGPDEALLTCKHMLQIWKSCYKLTNPSDSGRGSSLLDRVIADRRNLNTVTLPDFSDVETGSVHATSIAASRVEQALSEVASSLQSSMPKQGPMHPWMTLAQIWLHAAEVYIGVGKPTEATACIQEAANLFPTSHNVLFMRGQVAELRGNIDEAKRWYEEALSISPTHVKTMQRLGLVLHQLGRYSLAEKILRDAVQVNSTAHEVWNNLGEVLQAQGSNDAATECFLTALELEASSPIIPFTVIPRIL